MEDTDDFHTLKRRDLQALCKKHHIPANLTNLEMANRLTELLKVNYRTSQFGVSFDSSLFMKFVVHFVIVSDQFCFCVRLGEGEASS